MSVPDEPISERQLEVIWSDFGYKNPEMVSVVNIKSNAIAQVM